MKEIYKDMWGAKKYQPKKDWFSFNVHGVIEAKSEDDVISALHKSLTDMPTKKHFYIKQVEKRRK